MKPKPPPRHDQVSKPRGRNVDTKSPVHSSYFNSRTVCTAIIAVFLFFVNRKLLYTLFENDKHFSHLSGMEREMCFRTEMALYYSYYKHIVEADTLWEGLGKLQNDNLTEYPTTINALQRFNLFPEIVAGATFRLYSGLLCPAVGGCDDRVCYTVNRGPTLPPARSCEGMGEPIYFYVNMIFELNALVLPLIFIMATSVSDSIFGGVIAALCILFNFGECSRVMWTPPLRESWAFPIICLQLLAIHNTITSEQGSGSRLRMGAIAVTTAASLASWQFCHFNFTVLLVALSGVFSLGLVPGRTFSVVIGGMTAGYLLCFFSMLQNRMNFTSFLLTTLVSSWMQLYVQKKSRLADSFVYKILAPVGLIVNSVVLKFMLGIALNITDDAHVFNILRSKFTAFRDFHTNLYVCAKEFDFLGWEYVTKNVETLFIPLGALGFLISSLNILVFVAKRDLVKSTGESPDETRAVAAMTLHTGLAVGHGMLALLIMRLKLFFSPQLCIIAAMVAHPSWFKAVSEIELVRRVWSKILPNTEGMRQAGHPWRQVLPVRKILLMVLVALVSHRGQPVLQNALNRMGEYSNPELEQLFLWINQNTHPNDSFAGAMPTMANVRLSTGRPIVNHPHYEDSGARERTWRVYTIFGKFPVEEVVRNLKALQATYVIIEEGWCWARRPKGCSIYEAYEDERPDLADNQPLCPLLAHNPAPFERLFKNRVYQVLKV